MTLVHFIMLAGLLVGTLAYFLLFHDDVMEKRSNLAKLLSVKTEAEKIAKVKVLSTNSKDIEKFIIDNAKTLSDATIDILVNRMEMLATDKVIKDDDLKARIDVLTPAEEDTAAPTELKAVRKRK